MPNITNSWDIETYRRKFEKYNVILESILTCMKISNVAEDHGADLSQFNQRCSCRKQDGTTI